MTETNKEVINSHDYQENEKKKTSQENQDRCSIAVQCCRHISPREDNETLEISNAIPPYSPSSQDSGILSVESSNPPSVLSSSYFLSDTSDTSPCMPTPLTVQEDEGPDDQFTSTPSSPAVLLNALNIVGQEKQKQGTIPVLETNNPFKESRKDLEKKQSDRILEFKTTVQGNWIYIKNIIELSMAPMFEKVGLAREDDLRCLNTNKRSQKADMLIMRVLQRIKTDTDIRNFEGIVGRHVCEKLTLHDLKYYGIKENVQLCNLERLHLNREFLIKKLMTVDIEEVKDRLMQENIIDLDDNDRIINQPGFCERQNARFSRFFVDNYIIKLTFLGSYQCLMEYLEETISKGSTRLRQLSKSLTTDDLKQTYTAINEPVVSMRVQQKEYSENETVADTTDKDIEFKLKFKTEDEYTKKVYLEVKRNAKTNNGKTGIDFGGCINKTQLGSVVIHMVALKKEMVQNVLNMFRKKQFSDVVKMLLNDIQIKRCLPNGKHELEVTCYVKEKQENFVHGIGCKVHKLNHIADNKSFLEEEMDTLIVLKEFENRGVPIDIDVHDGDRIFRARYIINKALSDERIAKTLYKVLSESEMTNVTDRFLQYETVYGSDSSQLQKNIHKHFKEITNKVYLEDIRLIFTERNIFKDELFETEEQTGAENEVAMANILTEIIKRNDAMLTLVDALFQIQLDTLGTKLMKREPLDDTKIETKMKGPKCTNKQTKKNFDKQLLLTGRFEVSIRRRRRTSKKRCPTKKCSKTNAVTYKRKHHQLANFQPAATSRNDVRNNGRYCEKNKLIKLEEYPNESHVHCRQPDTEDHYDMYVHPANMSNDFAATQMASTYTCTCTLIAHGLSCQLLDARTSNMAARCRISDTCTVIENELTSRLFDARISDTSAVCRNIDENTAFKCIRSDEHFNDIGTKNHPPDSRIPFSSEEDHDFIVNNMDNLYNNLSAENHQSNLGFSSVNDTVQFYQQSDAPLGLAPSPTSTISSADSGYSTHSEGDEKAPFFQHSDASPGQVPSPSSSSISATDSGYSTYPETDDGRTEISLPGGTQMEVLKTLEYYSLVYRHQQRKKEAF